MAFTALYGDYDLRGAYRSTDTGEIQIVFYFYFYFSVDKFGVNYE